MEAQDAIRLIRALNCLNVHVTYSRPVFGQFLKIKALFFCPDLPNIKFVYLTTEQNQPTNNGRS